MATCGGPPVEQPACKRTGAGCPGCPDDGPPDACQFAESHVMQIWVDADACPAVIKDILFRAADRVPVQVTLVANSFLRTPPSKFIKAMIVPSGFDVADREIVRLLEPGDLVVSADIPLAADAIAKGALVLNPRGELYNEGNIRQHLDMRNFMEQLRSSGVDTGGPAAFSQADRHAFARQLDRLLAQASQ